MTAARVSIDEYIAPYPSNVQLELQRVRSTIHKAAPKAEEGIRYRMPTFSLKGRLVDFAAFKTHIGLFPPVRGDAKLKRDLRKYMGEKGNLRFPLSDSIPYNLITRVVKQRVKEMTLGPKAESATRKSSRKA